jgi:Transposase
MGEVSTIGLDVAKSVFQVHGVDSCGEVVICKRVRRSKLLEFFSALPHCLIGIEACPSAHYWNWSRELQALGHTVKLMPPSYVKAYLKRSKNDANDAAAICEAATRPSMRFVPIKSEQQQSGLMLHRSRQLLVRQRTMLSTRSSADRAGALRFPLVDAPPAGAGAFLSRCCATGRSATASARLAWNRAARSSATGTTTMKGVHRLNRRMRLTSIRTVTFDCNERILCGLL